MSDTLQEMQSEAEIGICTFCGKETNGYSAYPGDWPLIFPDKWEIHENKHMRSAIPVHHHVQCVIDKLDQLAAAQKKYNDALIHATKAEQYLNDKLASAQQEIIRLKVDNTKAYLRLALDVMSRIWVVEMFNDESRRWEPTVGCALTKQDGRPVVREWRTRNAGCRFRLVKYIKGKK